MRPPLRLGQIEAAELGLPDRDRYPEQRAHRRVMRWKSDRRRVRGQIIESQCLGFVEQNPEDSLPDGQLAQSGHGGGVQTRVMERDERAVGSAHAERSVTGPGQLHRRGHDPVQRGVEVEIRGETDDDPEQPLHLVARTQQLLDILVIPAH